MFYICTLRNVLTFQIAIFQVVVKCCVIYFTITFYFDALNFLLNLLLVQSKWLGWNHNDAKCRQLTRGDKMAHNLDKVEVLRCRWLNR